MRIGIDARWIFPKISGIGAYTRRLIENLAKIDSLNQYFIFSNNSGLIEKFHLTQKSNFSLVTLPVLPNSLGNQYLLPLKFKKLKLDIFHSPHFFAPLKFKGPELIVTIHDLIPLCFPHYTPRAKKVKFFWLFKFILKQVSQKAKKIITISENSKKDLVQSLKIEEGKIEVIYNGVSPTYRPLPFEDTKNKLAGVVPEKALVLLFVGRFDPYKNITGLIRAFKDLKSDFPELKLVIVGEIDRRYPEGQNLVKELKLGEEVIFTGYLEEEDLVYWYNRAKIFILPTFYEGFGLPVVEAFASGCPVITSRLASLPEVAGQAGILIDPHNQTELTEAIRRLLTDFQLREELRQKGLARAKIFTWERTARETLDVYEKIAR